MNLNEFQKAAQRTWVSDKNGATQRERMTLATLGLSGESGEVTDLIKKFFFHDKPFDRSKLILELGDVLFYIAAMSTELGATMEEVAQANVEKIRKRFPDGFDTARANAKADEAPRPLRVYVASKFENFAQVRQVQQVLREAGHHITYDWTQHVDEGEADKVACARADVEGVRSADCLLLLHHPNMRGAYVEFGIALALEKPILVVRPADAPAHVFEHLPSVRIFEQVGGALIRLTELARRQGAANG